MAQILHLIARFHKLPIFDLLVIKLLQGNKKEYFLEWNLDEKNYISDNEMEIKYYQQPHSVKDC